MYSSFGDLRVSSGCSSGVLWGGSEEGLWRQTSEKLMGSLGNALGTPSSSPGLGNLIDGSIVCSCTIELVERRRRLQRVGARGAVASVSFVCVGEAFFGLVEAIGVSCVMMLLLL